MLRLLFLNICIFLSYFVQAQIYEMQQGRIDFVSEAPLEIISARSNKLSGVLDISKKQFVFKVPISSFDGFNNGMQRGHFNENYMESKTFPTATFKGKIIEQIDPNQNGKISVRAKGKLLVHGVEQERIIMVTLNFLPNNKVNVESDFTVLLADHNIKIPKIVTEKLSPEIKVTVKGQMQIK